MNKILLTGALSAIILSSAAAFADTATPVTSTTVKTVTTDTTVVPPVTAPVMPAAPMYSSASVTTTGTNMTTTTTTDTTTIPVDPTKPVPVVAPSVKGHKPGDRADAQTHTATGSGEASAAGDKAANAVTPLKDSSVPGKGKVDVNGDTLIVH